MRARLFVGVDNSDLWHQAVGGHRGCHRWSNRDFRVDLQATGQRSVTDHNVLLDAQPAEPFHEFDEVLTDSVHRFLEIDVADLHVSTDLQPNY